MLRKIEITPADGMADHGERHQLHFRYRNITNVIRLTDAELAELRTAFTTYMDATRPIHLFGADAHGQPGFGQFPDSCGWPNQQCIGHAPRPQHNGDYGAAVGGCTCGAPEGWHSPLCNVKPSAHKPDYGAERLVTGVAHCTTCQRSEGKPHASWCKIGMPGVVPGSEDCLQHSYCGRNKQHDPHQWASEQRWCPGGDPATAMANGWYR